MFDFELPAGVKEANLIADKYRRPDHWYDPVSGQVFACPTGWKPGATEAPAPATDEPGEKTPVQKLVKANTLEKLQALATEEGVAFATDATKEQIATAIVAKREENE